MPPPKAEILAALRARLGEELAALERVAAMSRDEATSEQTRAEGKYDTRATEASYLAHGLSLRIAELRQISAWFALGDAEAARTSASVGALVSLEGSATELLFLAPVGGGRVSAAGYTVTVISPASPLGRALAGLEAGDAVEVDTPRGTQVREILGVW